MTQLQRYAEQCEAERLAAQITDDILSYVEIETDDLDWSDVRFVQICPVRSC